MEEQGSRYQPPTSFTVKDRALVCGASSGPRTAPRTLPLMFCAAPPMHVCEFGIPCPCLSITPALPLSQLKSTQRLPPPFLDMDCQAVLKRNDKTKPADDTQIRRLLSWFHQTALQCSLSSLSTSCPPYITSPSTSAYLFSHNRCLFLLPP